MADMLFSGMRQSTYRPDDMDRTQAASALEMKLTVTRNNEIFESN